MRIRVPGSGDFLTNGSGMGNKFGSGSGMINPNHSSESLVEIKILKFFDADPGWKNSDPGSGMEKFGSGISIPDPQHRPVGYSLDAKKYFISGSVQFSPVFRIRKFWGLLGP